MQESRNTVYVLLDIKVLDSDYQGMDEDDNSPPVKVIAVYKKLPEAESGAEELRRWQRLYPHTKGSVGFRTTHIYEIQLSTL